MSGYASESALLEEALDYGRFETWLRGYGDMVVGIPGVATACPLAIYLQESLPWLSHVLVNETRVETRAHGPRVLLPLPVWAVRFVKRVDRAAGPLMAEEAANLLFPGDLLVIERDEVRLQPSGRLSTVAFTPAV